MTEQTFDFGGNDVEDNEERIGGWAADESDVYVKAITQAFLTQSPKGAYAINLSTKDKEGNERDYQFYFTNRAGATYYTKSGKKHQLPGYALLNSICMTISGQTAQQVLSKPKKAVIDLMDWESRKEVPTEVKTYPQICKKPVKLAIVKVIDNAYKKGKITNEPREKNEIKMAFDAKTNLTITEVAKGLKEPKLHEGWLKQWKGKPDNQFVKQEDEEEIEVTDGDDPFGAEDEALDDVMGGTATTDADATSADSADDDDEDMFS